MSTEAIALLRSGELTFNFIDTDNKNFEPEANSSLAFACPPPLSGFTAGHPIEALSAPNAGATDTAATAPSFLSELHNARIRADVADLLGANDSLITGCCTFSMPPQSVA